MSPEPWERSRVTFALQFTGPEASDWYRWTDEELERHYRAWAREQGAGHHGEAWGETTYAYWRFERGLSVDDAIDAAGDAFDAAQKRQLDERSRRKAAGS